MNLLMGKHPKWWPWYMCLQQLSALAHIRWGQLREGDRPRKQKKCEFVKTEVLKKLWDRLDNGELKSLQFLELCSKTYKFYFDSVNKILESIFGQNLRDNFVRKNEPDCSIFGNKTY